MGNVTGFRTLSLPMHELQRGELDRIAAERGMRPTTLARAIVYQWLRDQRNVNVSGWPTAGTSSIVGRV